MFMGSSFTVATPLSYAAYDVYIVFAYLFQN